MTNSRLLQIFMGILLMTVVGGACVKSGKLKKDESVPIQKPDILLKQCEENVGKPRVEKITDRIWVAIGYDLANVVLIHTDDGNVVVDTGMSPARAAEIKNAFLTAAPAAPVKAIIYTHSHIDHIGGASVWAEKGAQIWATDAFLPHFLKQYGMFRPSETQRGLRQFGLRASLVDLPCSALGRRIDYEGATGSGIRLPTNTFSGTKVLEIGGVKMELVESHGETPDQLIIWIPSEKTVIAADNFYWTFPNLYTIRGTSPRPVNDWIRSLDDMRRFAPEHLVPMHTKPIHGQEEIAKALTDYRDAIQWVRDEVVRRANRGEDIETLAENIKLPPRLADKPYLAQLYGQVDWSAKGIYTNYLGWFDGRADKLYPMPKLDAARREITLMGGPQKILDLADQALQMGDARWAVHLLAKLSDSKLAAGDLETALNKKLAQSYMKLAEGIPNTNGRGYLIESAAEITQGPANIGAPKVGDEIASNVPIDMIFEIMATRLDPEKAADVYESVQFVFPDINKQVTLTIRYGVAEVVEGDPLPGTPDPIAVFTSDSLTYRRIAMDLEPPAKAFASGKVKVDGSTLKFLKFLDLFQKGV